ncbi:hypothetical protein Zmor_024662 [Zophobas morio]|uniref:G-protein coupled receptors family 1 profile domain-containing protein n=1 Tax=Zophobas morio TaxID=2755281 RepID=A0AA38HZA7_9CUCU|nr:hypothetical protein Zmor_024662 [Zophobas morio]
MGDECGGGTSSNDTELKNADQNDCVLPDTLSILSDYERFTFMGIFVVFSVLSLCGNCAAIYSISKRKYRYVQKTCIVSLAVSDILSTIVIATNNLETFSHELLVWVSSIPLVASVFISTLVSLLFTI